MKHLILLTSLCWLITFNLSKAQNPTDQFSSFQKFKEHLVTAVNNNDTLFIFNHLSSDVFNGFGSDNGKEIFRRLWKDPRTDLRKELQTALRLGTMKWNRTSADPLRYYAPAYFLTFPDSLDVFTHSYITQDSVNVYAKPDFNSDGFAITKNSIVKVLRRQVFDHPDMDTTTTWSKISTFGEKSGFVQRRYLRSPIDYRFWFERKNDKWYIMGWAAGD